jgi:hypothetical protein
MRVAAKHVGLDNVNLRELFETQPGEVMGWLAAMLHQEVGRNHLRSAAPKRQDQHKSCDTTGLSNAMATISPISATFSRWTAKVFHNQGCFLFRIVIFVKYRSPQAWRDLMSGGVLCTVSWDAAAAHSN